MSTTRVQPGYERNPDNEWAIELPRLPYILFSFPATSIVKRLRIEALKTNEFSLYLCGFICSDEDKKHFKLFLQDAFPEHNSSENLLVGYTLKASNEEALLRMLNILNANNYIPSEVIKDVQKTLAETNVLLKELMLSYDALLVINNI